MTVTNCLSRENLKSYLAGWTDETQLEEIESHLADCEACEQTVVDLESDPDTLVEFVRIGTPVAAEQSALQSALSKARQLRAISNDSSKSPATWRPPSDQIGAYELLRPLGHGGMASVYLARHTQLGKQVAIKLLPSHSFRNEYFAARFQREIRAAGGLEHPSIVQATDAGEHDGTHFLVMEHVDGLDVSRIARLCGKMSVANACELTRQVALGLSHAHAEGIVHRDVKPSNLMLNSSGEAKILDFGLARVAPWDEMSAELTSVGQLMGTLDYMAPEQAERAEAVDYRADLYALGATLFKLLSGRPPLAAAPDLSPLAKLRLLASKQAPPQLHTLRPHVPQELSKLVEQLLAYNADARPASAAHVAELLEHFCQGHDLQELARSAVEKAAQQEEDLTPHSLLTSPLPSTPAGSPAESHGAGGSWIRRIVQLGTLGAVIFAGILIVLDTQKGQVLIDSEVAANVELRQDGQVAKEIQVTPGANTTRVYAGKYEVVLSSGSDGVALDREQLTVSRRGVTFAKISRRDAGFQPDRSSAPEIPDLKAPLRPGDAVRIQSLTDSTIARSVVLAADSTIRLPLIGTFDASNQTMDQLRGSLERAFKEYLQSPALDVFPDMNLWQKSGIPPAQDVPLKPGDQLLITSLVDETIKDFSAIVGQNYLIRVPMVGAVSVKNRTVGGCEELLNQAYEEIYASPMIHVFRDFRPTANSANSQASRIAQNIETDVDSSPAESGPVYNGKPLSQWLGVLEVERSPSALGEAFSAVKSLVTDDTSDQITSLLLRLIPTLDGKMKVSRERLRSLPTGGMGPSIDESSLDSEAFQILRAANKNDFGQLLVDELEKGQQDWSLRIIEYLHMIEETQRQPLHNWLIDHLGGLRSERAETISTFSSKVAEYCRGLASYTTDDQLADQLFSALAACPVLDSAFWLDGSILNLDQFKPRLVEIVRERAESQILDDDSPQLMAQAAMILAAHPDWIDASTKSTLNERLGKIIQDQYERQGLDFLDVPSDFDSHIAPARVSTRSSRRSVGFSGFNSRNPSMVTLSMEQYQTNLPLKLLALAEALQLEIYDELIAIQEENQAAWEMVGQFKSGKSIELRWPSMQVSAMQSARGGGRSSPNARTQNSRPPKQTDWMRFFINDAIEVLVPPEEVNKEKESEGSDSTSASNQRPATIRGMTRSQLAQLLGQGGSRGQGSPAQAATSSPRSNPGQADILFRGRSLADWIKIIPLERSSAGITEALEAVYSLTEDQTSDYIWNQLTETLPQVDWKENFSRNSSSPYASAFRILRKAKPAEFYPYVLNQLRDEGAPEWKQRLIRHSCPSNVELEDIAEILGWIQENAFASKNEFTDASFYAIRAINDYPTRSADDQKQLMKMIADCGALKNNYALWLKSLFSQDPFSGRSIQTKPIGSVEFQQLVVSKAMEVLHEDSNTLLRVMALKALSAIHEVNVVNSDRGRFSPTRPTLLNREEITKLALSRLSSMASWDVNQLLRTVETEFPFGEYAKNPYRRYISSSFLASMSPPRSKKVATSELYLLLNNIPEAAASSRIPTKSLLQLTDLSESESFHADLFRIGKTLVPLASKVAAAIHRDLWQEEGPVSQLYRGDLGTFVVQWTGKLDDNPVGGLGFTERDLLAYYLFQMCRLSLDNESASKLGKELTEAARDRFVDDKFSSADANKDEQLSFLEYSKHAPRIGKYFGIPPAIVDRDADKHVSKSEFRWACDNFERILSFERWAAQKPSLKSLREPSDGSLTLDQWTDLIKSELAERDLITGRKSR